MKPAILYIEQGSGNHNGTAWIGKATFSKSGRTVYFNSQAFKKSHGAWGNHRDLMSGDEYWVSGIKKNGQDRHWAGGGKILVDRSIVSEYLEFMGWERLDPQRYEVVDILPTDKQSFSQLENQAMHIRD